MNHTDETILTGVLDQFTQLCRHPHPSWGEGPLADYVEDLLRQRGLSPLRDEWNNIMVDLPATPGREAAPLTMIQGHLDMVCAVKPGSGWNPASSPVVCVTEDGLLRSDGNSSLGADNNLGNAAVLWLLGQDIPHGPIRLLFTTAEEVGLQGAKRLDPAWLSGGQFLINTDGFSLGRTVISSAGGLREKFFRPLEYAPRTKPCLFALELTGFPGGHSGYDIHRDRPNPIALTARWLRELKQQIPFELVSLSGGHAENAIPMDCTALLAVDTADIPALETQLKLLTERTGSHGTACLTRRDSGPDTIWTEPFRDQVVDTLAEVYHGVFTWRDAATEQVSTSANLGSIKADDGQLFIDCFIRFTSSEDEQSLAQLHRTVAEKGGFQIKLDRYPAWEEAKNDRLVSVLARTWQTLRQEPMEFRAVHVGLEPAVLGAKNPDMLMVSTGPTIHDPHSLDERAPLADLPDYVRLLAGTLNELSK